MALFSGFISSIDEISFSGLQLISFKSKASLLVCNLKRTQVGDYSTILPQYIFLVG